MGGAFGSLLGTSANGFAVGEFNVDLLADHLTLVFLAGQVRDALCTHWCLSFESRFFVFYFVKHLVFVCAFITGSRAVGSDSLVPFRHCPIEGWYGLGVHICLDNDDLNNATLCVSLQTFCGFLALEVGLRRLIKISLIIGQHD